MQDSTIVSALAANRRPMNRIYADDVDAFIPGWSHWLSDKGIRWFHCPSDRMFRAHMKALGNTRPSDSWTDGIFTIDLDGEPAIIVRRLAPSVVAHESGHALDTVLAQLHGIPERWYSNRAKAVKDDYERGVGRPPLMHTWNRQEFFAECFRAYVGAHDRSWQSLTGSTFDRNALHDHSPAIWSLFEAIWLKEVRDVRTG